LRGDAGLPRTVARARSRNQHSFFTLFLAVVLPFTLLAFASVFSDRCGWRRGVRRHEKTTFRVCCWPPPFPCVCVGETHGALSCITTNHLVLSHRRVNSGANVAPSICYLDLALEESGGAPAEGFRRQL